MRYPSYIHEFWHFPICFFLAFAWHHRYLQSLFGFSCMPTLPNFQVHFEGLYQNINLIIIVKRFIVLHKSQRIEKICVHSLDLILAISQGLSLGYLFELIHKVPHNWKIILVMRVDLWKFLWESSHWYLINVISIEKPHL